MEKTDIYKIIMSEFRCSNCNKQIFKGKLRSDYHIEAFCPRCKNITIFERSSIAKKDKIWYNSNELNNRVPIRAPGLDIFISSFGAFYIFGYRIRKSEIVCREA